MRKILVILCLASCQSVFFGQINLIWDASYNGEGDFNDRYNATAKDNQGNIYSGGSVVNPGQDRDILITKINSNGTLVWSKMFNGSASGPDEIQSITVDLAGNLYVTGFVKNNITSQDIVTIKLNPNGDTLWCKAYDYVNEYDQGNSIAVDALGNVYVTGQSDSDPSMGLNDDYVSLKYDANGNMLWVNRFNGQGNATDRAVKIVLDSLGNSLITGRSNNGIDDDYVTIKYDNSGVQQWIKYDDRGGRDRATDMAINEIDGLIYITGKSENGNNYDFWTLCYDLTGNLIWDQPFDFVEDDNAVAICVDINGNCFVTGESDSDPSPTQNFDYQTVAYSPGGNVIWQERFAGPAGNNDSPTDITICGSSVVVSGNQDSDPSAALNRKMTLISYGIQNGAVNWNTLVCPSPHLKSDAAMVISNDNGCIAVGYVDGSTQQKNAFIVNLNNAGMPLWNNILNGLGDNNDNIRSLAVDNNYSIFTAGYAVENGMNRNISMIKFSSGGVVQCVNTLDGSSTGSEDDGQGLILDNSGNAIVAGFLKNKSTSNDLEIASFNNTNCDTLWTKTIDGPGHGSDKIYDITRDGSGFIYVTGRQDFDPSSAINYNCYVAKMNNAGVVLWQQTYGSAGNYEDRGVSIKVSSSGNIYVTGRSWNGTDFDIFLLKYNNSGVQQWVQIYNGGFGNDEPKELVIDNSENILIGGRTEELTDSLYDYLALKYNPAGTLDWFFKYNGVGAGNDEATGISIDNIGNIALVGKSDVDNSPSVNFDMVVVYLNSNGNLIWTYPFNGISNLDDIGDDIQFNNYGQIYLTGHTNKGTAISPNFDIVTLILHPNGSLLWSHIYNGSSDSSDIPNLIYLTNNDFYVAGSTIKTNEMRNMLLLKYSGTVHIPALEPNTGIMVSPNPFMDEIQILISTEFMNASIEILDMMGRSVMKGILSNQQTSISIPELTIGTYMYRVTSANGVQHTGLIEKIN